MSKLVYLAGPISGCSFNGCNDWREDWIAEFDDGGNIECLSPMRGKKQYLKDLQAIPDHLSMPLCTPQAIMSRDYFDANRADVIVFNMLGVKTRSIGTIMEAAWGYTRHTPMVWIIEADGSNPHEHAMLNQCMSFRTQDEEEAKHIVRAILDPYFGTNTRLFMNS